MGQACITSHTLLAIARLNGHILTTRKAGNIFWRCLLEDEGRFGDELLDYASASQTWAASEPPRSLVERSFLGLSVEISDFQALGGAP